MNLTAIPARGRISRPAPQGILPVVRKSLPQPRTNRIERFFLIVTIVSLPLQEFFPRIPGFSIVFIIFILSGGYVLFKRPVVLARILLHPLFVTAYILLALASLIELLHPYASYDEISRTGQLIAGAIIIASLCRDRSALRAAMYSSLIAGMGLAVYAYLTSFHILSGATATDFNEASRIRSEAFKDTTINFNWVALACAKGAVVALASTLSAHAPHRRYLFLGITVFCAMAGLLSLSRTGAMMIIVSFAAVILAGGVRRGRTLLMAGVIGALTIMWIPDVVWSRLTFSTETRNGKMEGRAAIYTAAAEHFPEYAMIGVGSGNFWGPWGRQSSYNLGLRSISGAHNVFIQVTIYWGLAALFALIAVVWQAYRCLPRHYGADTLSLQLLGVCVAVLMLSLATHVLATKDFALVLGLLVGARRWIWPNGIVHPTARKQRLPRPTIARMS